MKRYAFAAALVAALGVMAAPAFAGKQQAVKVGSYTGQPKINKGSYSEGEWAVARKQGKRKMVPSPQYPGGIYYPDAGKCDPYDVPLTDTSVPISSKGRFHVKDKRQVVTQGGGTKTITVDWKGRWTTSKRVKGTIKISFKSCTDKRSFTGQYSG